MEDLKKLFGTNLRNCRKSRNMTQMDLAWECQISIEMVGKIERGVAAPSFGSMTKLATALGVQEGAFFDITGAGLPQCERTKRVQKIYMLLAHMNNTQLKRCKKILQALME